MVTLSWVSGITVGCVKQTRQAMVKTCFSSGLELILFTSDHRVMSGQPGRTLNNGVVRLVIIYFGNNQVGTHYGVFWQGPCIWNQNTSQNTKSFSRALIQCFSGTQLSALPVSFNLPDFVNIPREMQWALGERPALVILHCPGELLYFSDQLRYVHFAYTSGLCSWQLVASVWLVSNATHKVFLFK